MKHSIAIPFSAAVKRLVLQGKDVLKPKHSGISNEYFEALVVRKSCILINICFCAVFAAVRYPAFVITIHR